MKTELVVETKGLSKRYHDQVIVKDVDMHIEKGKIYGLLGRNGAGKTTIMKMMLGLTSISSGDICMFGKSVRENGRRIYPRVGSLIETTGFYPTLSAYDNLRVFARLKGKIKRDAIESALELVNLSCTDKKPFSSYSLGMKQRLGLANALMNDPEFLILDEPTNGLDPIGIAELREFIQNLSKKEGKTVLLSSHQLSEVEQLADTIGVLHNQRLIEECSLEDIENYNQKSINVQISDVNKAALLLEQEFGIKQYKVMNSDTIRIFDFSKEPKAINRMFWEHGVEVSMLNVILESLEEHFKEITGGVGIA